MVKNENIVTLETLLQKFDAQTKKFIKELEKEEDNERIETLDSIINDIKAQKQQTNIQKSRFIVDIKSGLGSKIKEEPFTVIKHDKPWYVKVINWFKNIFTKF